MDLNRRIVLIIDAIEKIIDIIEKIFGQNKIIEKLRKRLKKELNNSKNEENIVTKQDAKAFLQIIEILDEIYSYK